MEQLYGFIILGIALFIIAGVGCLFIGFFDEEIGKAGRICVFVFGACMLWYAINIAIILNTNIAMFK
jgi:hypothetical protein